MSDAIESIGDAFERLRGLIGEQVCVEEANGFVHPGAPFAKSRARRAKNGHFYTQKKTEIAQESVAYAFKQCLKEKRFKGNLALLAVFFRPNLQRIDGDNLLKLVMDAGTMASAWDDDCQVTISGSIVELDKENPRTIVVMCDCPSSLPRGDDAKNTCERCGTRFFRTTQGENQPRWCSKKCMNLLAVPMKCARCGTLFKRRTNGKYCSISCRGMEMSDRGNKRNRERWCCKYGHSFDPANTYLMPNGKKRCRKCQAARARDYRGRMTTVTSKELT